jgi:7-cyano-7-deazaguanine synthase
MIKFGTKNNFNIKIETPLINLSKKDIVLKSIRMKSPLHLTWSCYKSNDFACGECDSCALRLRGFERAGKIDPIKYKKIINLSL